MQSENKRIRSTQHVIHLDIDSILFSTLARSSFLLSGSARSALEGTLVNLPPDLIVRFFFAVSILCAPEEIIGAPLVAKQETGANVTWALLARAPSACTLLYLSNLSNRRLLPDVPPIPLGSKWKAWGPTMSSKPVFLEELLQSPVSGSTNVGF